MRRTLGLLLAGLLVCQVGFATLVVSGDFKAGAQLFTGVETWAQAANPVFGAADVWNAMNVPYLAAYPGLTVAPFTNLVDSSGNATGVSFQFLGPLSAYNSTTSTHATNLFSDFVYLDPFLPGINTGTSLGWEITGLVPNSTADMYFYDINNVDSGGRGFFMVVQGSGYYVDGYAGVYVAGIHADGSGDIAGTMVWTGGQASWSGFQLAGDPLPEPSTLLLLPAGIVLLALRRRT